MKPRSHQVFFPPGYWDKGYNILWSKVIDSGLGERVCVLWKSESSHLPPHSPTAAPGCPERPHPSQKSTATLSHCLMIEMGHPSEPRVAKILRSSSLRFTGWNHKAKYYILVLIYMTTCSTHIQPTFHFTLRKVIWTKGKTVHRHLGVRTDDYTRHANSN